MRAGTKPDVPYDRLNRCLPPDTSGGTCSFSDVLANTLETDGKSRTQRERGRVLFQLSRRVGCSARFGAQRKQSRRIAGFPARQLVGWCLCEFKGSPDASSLVSDKGCVASVSPSIDFHNLFVRSSSSTHSQRQT